MLSSDRFEPPGPHRRRKARRGARTAGAGAGTLRDHTARRQAQDPHGPWDAHTAEALTRLYESDEGQLHKPYAGERAPHARPQAKALAAEAGETGAHDRAWMESHLSDLAERLQASVARLDPDASLSALNRRLEAIEERFSIALERVAQRADLDGLRAIEAHVLDLATHLDRTRDRLEQIGGLEDQVRGLAQRLDEGDQQQVGALGKLLRDYIAEWRESEQRSAGALHNLEEAISRLGDTVDAMEASKPAPDLSLPTLAGPEPGRARMASDPLSQVDAASEGAVARKSYHSMLDAADYAPKTLAEGLTAGTSEPRQRLPALPDAAIQWSADPADAVRSRPAARDSGPSASRIMAVREKLRQAQASATDASNALDMRPPAPERDPRSSAAIKRTRPSLLLIAGVAFLAGGTYLLVQAFMTAVPVPTGPARIEPGAQPSGTKAGIGGPRTTAGWPSRRELTPADARRGLKSAPPVALR